MGIQFAQQVETTIPSIVGLTQSPPTLDIFRPVLYPPTPADAAAMAILGTFGLLGVGTQSNPEPEPMAFIKQGVVISQFASSFTQQSFTAPNTSNLFH